MKRASPPRNAPAKLSDSLHHQLSMYSMAASAAGVSLLASVHPVEARVVYTAAHHVIGSNSRFPLDLDHDGITDFTLGYNSRTVTSGTSRSVYASAAQGNGVEGTAGSQRFLAGALKRGTRIPNRHRFSQTKARMAYQCDGFIGSCPQTTFFSGNWVNVKNRYLGLKFKVHGKTHYGWARLRIQWVNSSYSFSATLTGYAYETIPNKPILTGRTKGPNDSAAQSDGLSPHDPGPGGFLTSPISNHPQPASLGMLALGAQAGSM
jgi:hypothetical protein